MRRDSTGGMEEEDVSTYGVTIHRNFAKDVSDWTGEVTGVPSFFPLKTVDVIAAGKTIYVFNKSNKKLWEGKLTYAVKGRYSDERPPCLETKEAVYFADPGVLTRFDLATGDVAWRFNSVGITKVQEDRRGGLIVNSTTAGPETIKYSQQLNVHDHVHALMLKLAPSSGKIIWQQESLGDSCIFSGKFLYATKISQAYAALRFEQGPDTAYMLRLLNPSSGGQIWEKKFVNHTPYKTEIKDNWILLQFDDEVRVLKFFSL
jgi:outer membrane protein assembly factor BamB